MQYSQTENNPLEKLKTLLATEDAIFLKKKSGGNSVVSCVEAGGQKWAVKSYPPYAPGQRDRLLAEVSAYRFLNQNKIAAVPTLKTFCNDNRLLVIDWIEGDIPNEYSTFDIDQAIQFIHSIDNLNATTEAKNLPLAAEACLSLTILCNQIKQRLQRLQALPEQEPELTQFLSEEFFPQFERFQIEAKEIYLKHQLHPDSELSEQCRSLIPADFGFHNSIKDANGKLYFFDFDYFGWDDPVKLLADILWHPKMHLTEMQQEQFIQGLANVYSADSLFMPRFHATRSLFGLRWVLILLNEFIPAFWQNRQYANVYQNQDEAKKIQLERAKELLLNVQKNRIAI